MDLKEELEASTDEFLPAWDVSQAAGFKFEEFLIDVRSRSMEMHQRDGKWFVRADPARRVYFRGHHGAATVKWTRGGVYFIRCCDFVKIGIALHLTSRLQMFRLHNPHDLEVLHFIRTPGTAAARHIEKQLHQRFTHARHRGEWFRRCAEIDAFITAEKNR